MNVIKSIKIGIQRMTEFQCNLLDAFHERLSSKENLKTIKTLKRDMAFSHVVHLISMDELDFSSAFNYELVPVLTSIFKDTGDARYTSTKSVLKNKPKKEVSSRN